MKTFFEHLYYYIYLWYGGKEKNGSQGKSCVAVSGLQFFNLLSIVFLWNDVTRIFIDIPKLVIALLYLILFVINYMQYIYSDEKGVIIENNWKSKSDESQTLYEKVILCYIFISCIIVFGLALMGPHLLNENT